MNSSVDLGLLVARLGVGLTMLFGHGLVKVSNYAMLSDRFVSFMGLGPALSLNLAILAEVGGSLLVIFGLFSRIGSFLVMCTMVGALVMVHSADPFAKQELPLVYLIIFTSIFIAGPGRYSLQNLFKISSASKFPFLAWFLK